MTNLCPSDMTLSGKYWSRNPTLHSHLIRVTVWILLQLILVLSERSLVPYSQFLRRIHYILLSPKACQSTKIRNANTINLKFTIKLTLRQVLRHSVNCEYYPTRICVINEVEFIKPSKKNRQKMWKEIVHLNSFLYLTECFGATSMNQKSDSFSG